MNRQQSITSFTDKYPKQKSIIIPNHNLNASISAAGLTLSIDNTSNSHIYSNSNILSSIQTNIDNPNNINTTLLKSKACIDKLTSKISQSKILSRNINTLKCVENTAKEIKYTIENKIQNTFVNTINQQTRVNFHQVFVIDSGNKMGSDKENKEDAMKKLMQDYWQKRQESQSQARRKTMIQCKQNLFPKIKSTIQVADQNSLSQSTKPKKKAIVSSLNVKLYQKHKQKQSMRRSKQQKILAYLYSYMVHVIDYKIQNDTPQFLLFQKLNYAKWQEIDNALKAVQNFSKKYELKYCTLDLQKVMQLLQTKSKSQKIIKSSKPISKNVTFSHLPGFQAPSTSINQKTNSSVLQINNRYFTPHQLLSLLQNNQQISTKNSNKAGIRFFGNKGKIRSIIKIQAVWKGKIVYNKTKKTKQLIKKVIKIQKAFKIYLGYLKTKQLIKQECIQRYKWFQQKQQKFKSTYRINQLTKKIKYQIHICSDSQSQWQRVSTQNFIQKQNAYITRIFKAFKENQIKQTRIIFITTLPVSAEIINYYMKLLELGGATNYKNKIYFMSPQNCDKFIDKIPLTRILYYCPSVLKKIKTIIQNQYSYIVPSTPSMDFISLCKHLDVPLYSSQPQILLHLQTNSGYKTFLQQLYKQLDREGDKDKIFEHNILPYATNIYSLSVLVNQLTFLIQARPNTWRWILKIDNQTNSRGIAYLDMNKIIPKKMLKYMRKAHNQFKINSNNNLNFDNIPHQIKCLTKQIYNHVLQAITQGEKLIIANKTIYRTQGQFLNFFYSNGGVVQAQVNSCEDQAENLCFVVQIEPDKEWKFLSAYRKMTIKKRSLCCYYDSNLMQPPIQIESIVKQLIKIKCFGFFMLQFIKQAQNQDIQTNNSRKVYWNGIKCYLDPYSSATYMRQFISKQSNMLYIPFISHSNIKKITMSTFFHLCRLQNISFDIQRKIGNIFMFLDGLQSGCLGMLTFNNTSKTQTFIHAAEVLDFFSSKIDHSVNSGPTEEFLLIRNSINGYLNNLRKKKMALKSTTQNSQKSKRQINRKASYKDRDYLS